MALLGGYLLYYFLVIFGYSWCPCKMQIFTHYYVQYVNIFITICTALDITSGSWSLILCFGFSWDEDLCLLFDLISALFICKDLQCFTCYFLCNLLMDACSVALHFCLMSTFFRISKLNGNIFQTSGLLTDLKSKTFFLCLLFYTSV